MSGTIALVLWVVMGAGEIAPSDRVAVALSGDEADGLIRQGIELRRAGRDEEALDLFRRAESVSPSPRARAQMGFAEQALGRWVAASNELG